MGRARLRYPRKGRSAFLPVGGTGCLAYNPARLLIGLVGAKGRPLSIIESMCIHIEKPLTRPGGTMGSYNIITTLLALLNASDTNPRLIARTETFRRSPPRPSPIRRK